MNILDDGENMASIPKLDILTVELDGSESSQEPFVYFPPLDNNGVGDSKIDVSAHVTDKELEPSASYDHHHSYGGHHHEPDDYHGGHHSQSEYHQPHTHSQSHSHSKHHSSS